MLNTVLIFGRTIYSYKTVVFSNFTKHCIFLFSKTIDTKIVKNDLKNFYQILNLKIYLLCLFYLFLNFMHICSCWYIKRMLHMVYTLCS